MIFTIWPFASRSMDLLTGFWDGTLTVTSGVVTWTSGDTTSLVTLTWGALTVMRLTALGNDLRLCAYDLECGETAAVRNYAALRMLCVARQIGQRFGRVWA